MIVKRLIPALSAVVLLAGCGSEPADDDGRAASGEVLEGTISDAMLPVDRVRSEAPLEDPEAFAEVRTAAAADDADDEAAADEGEEAAPADADAAPDEAPEPAEG